MKLGGCNWRQIAPDDRDEGRCGIITTKISDLIDNNN